MPLSRVLKQAGSGSGLALATVLAFATSGVLASPRLPDLVPDQATSLRYDVATAAGSSSAVLLFDGYVRNAGSGVLELRASHPDGREGAVMKRVVQRVYHGTGIPGPFYTDLSSSARVMFETTDGHDHFHVKDAARYALEASGATVQVAAKSLVGFCLRDNQRFGDAGSAVPYYFADAAVPPNCGAGLPTSPLVIMGITHGWRDRYVWLLPFQYIDVSNVAPGAYSLTSTVDPADVISEGDESNNARSEARVPVTVPGYGARDAQVDVAGASEVVDLAATRYETSLTGWPDLGAPQFKVVEAPRHGRVEGADDWTADAEVTYVPDPGFVGVDDFTFAVRDSANPAIPVESSTGAVRVRVLETAGAAV